MNFVTFATNYKLLKGNLSNSQKMLCPEFFPTILQTQMALITVSIVNINFLNISCEKIRR